MSLKSCESGEFKVMLKTNNCVFVNDLVLKRNTS